MRSRRMIVSRNIIFSLALQLVNMVSGFILPKVLLRYFGSEVNGLISSINQFLSYITLLEGGLSSVIMAGLYKPLQIGDVRQISGVINAAEHFFRKIAFIYLAYVLVLSFIYPFRHHASFTYGYTFALVWVLAMNLFTQYYFSLTFKLLIQADQKAYIVSMVQIIIVTLNVIATVLTTRLCQNILVIKLIGVIFCFIQPVFFSKYIKAHYEIDKRVPADGQSISQRWEGFWQNIAFFVHSNTDIVVLTLFSSLTNVSIYVVYLLVINGLKTLIISISGAIVPTLGNLLASEREEEIKSAFDLYEFIIFFVTTFLFSAGMSLIVPFVTIYTQEIKDANYYQPIFAILMVIAEAVYCLRDPYVSICNAAGHFTQTKKFAMMEAIINIGISVILVRRFGIVGVALGTLVAMLSRTLGHVMYLKNAIISRERWYAIKMITISFLVIIGIYFISNKVFNLVVMNYYEWVVLAIKISTISLIIIVFVSVLLYKKQIQRLVRLIFR